MPTQYEYAATVGKVVDGDTVHLILTKSFTFPVDFGFNILDQVVLQKTANQDIRLYGINAPELHGSQAVAGLASKNELTRLLGLGTLRVVIQGQDKYGRWLGTIYVQPVGAMEFSANDVMVNEGFAAVYFGEGPKPV